MWRDEGFHQVCKNLLGLAIDEGRTLRGRRRAPADVTSRAASSLDAGLAVERLEKCAVGTQEDWAGARRAIDQRSVARSRRVRRNVGFSDAETRQTRPELGAAIEKCNACDLANEAATRRVEVQGLRRAPRRAERGARAGPVVM